MESKLFAPRSASSSEEEGDQREEEVHEQNWAFFPSSPTSFSSITSARPSVRVQPKPRTRRGPANERTTCFRCYLAGWMEMGLGWDGAADPPLLSRGRGSGSRSGRGRETRQLGDARPLTGSANLAPGVSDLSISTLWALGCGVWGHGCVECLHVEVWMCGCVDCASSSRRTGTLAARLRLGASHTPGENPCNASPWTGACNMHLRRPREMALGVLGDRGRFLSVYLCVCSVVSFCVVLPRRDPSQAKSAISRELAR